MSARNLEVLLLAVSAAAAFGCFTWGTLRHFVWHGAGASGAWVISLVSWMVFVLFVWRLGVEPLSRAWMLSPVLFAASMAGWAWAVRHTKATPPTLAFTGDAPRTLFDGGPYRWVRHPFYTSYMLFWVGTALATDDAIGWPVMALIGALYWVAARYEEGKFIRSGLADDYRAYHARTGMFMPRLWHDRRASADRPWR